MRRLLIASNNPGKLMEIRALLQGLELDLVDPDMLGLRLSIEESGKDYVANARMKAFAWTAASGIWSIADDSGLEVDALDGAPGIHSARFAGLNRSDAERRQFLLMKLHPYPRPWTARFICAVVLANPEKITDVAIGKCEGEIIPTEKGENGFGYDPIFLVRSVDRTMAELTNEEKNRLSHRARAVQAILPILRERMKLDPSYNLF
jgi:XTP/dITP diphosphohydrolase